MSNSDFGDDDNYETNEQAREYMANLADLLFEGLLKPERETKDERCLDMKQEDERIKLWLSEILTDSQPFPGDVLPVDPTFVEGDTRFIVQ